MISTCYMNTTRYNLHTCTHHTPTAGPASDELVPSPTRLLRGDEDESSELDEGRDYVSVGWHNKTEDNPSRKFNLSRCCVLCQHRGVYGGLSGGGSSTQGRRLSLTRG